MNGPAASEVFHDTRQAGSAVLVAQHFLPLNVVASQRALRMARTLLDRFERVVVFHGDTSSSAPELLDLEFGRDVLDDPRLVRVAVRAGLSQYGYGRVTSPLQRLVGGAATRLLCGPGFDWVKPLRRALLKEFSPGDRVRVVLATGPPFITFGVTTQFAAARQAPVILDYRDLWTSNPHAPYPALARRAVNRWIERPLARRSSLITTVSEGCRSALQTDGASMPVRVLYNSPDRAYLAHYREVVAEWQRRRVTPAQRLRQKVRIVFAGQVYRNCTFAPLLKAIAAVPPERAAQIEVHYYGDSSFVVRQEFEQFGVPALLTDHGRVSKDDSLRAMLDADLLLSLIHTDRVSSDPAVRGHMSTKIYDYFLSGVPILNIGPVNADVNAFAAAIGHPAFHSMPADDTAAIGRAIDEIAASPRSGGEPLRVVLPDFDRAFSAILDETISAKTATR